MDLNNSILDWLFDDIKRTHFQDLTMREYDLLLTKALIKLSAEDTISDLMLELRELEEEREKKKKEKNKGV